ncbi:MAG: glycosyltransferase [Bacteroidota bacterium]
MTIYFTAALLLSLAYIVIICIYINGWSALPEFPVPASFHPATPLSIIVPARNEAKNILPCLKSILQQDYPTELFEVIVIDDHSTDETAQLVEGLEAPQLRLLKLAEHLKAGEHRAYKKKAIELGISQAKGQLILTTDADCIAPPQWLHLMAAFYEQKGCKFIAAPVNFYQEQSLLESFQSLDFMGMMGITGAGIHKGFMHMCNGANLAYEKAVFEEVGGFAGIDQLASGDDMLLMQKVAQKYPGQLGFLKQAAATVLTPAAPTLKAFLQQRLRWASKSKAYSEWKITLILALVFFLCINILLGVILFPFLGIGIIWPLLLQIGVKLLMDYLLLSRMSTFFNRSDLMRVFIPAQGLHLLYIAFIGAASNLINQYQWKGRLTR